MSTRAAISVAALTCLAVAACTRDLPAATPSAEVGSSDVRSTTIHVAPSTSVPAAPPSATTTTTIVDITTIPPTTTPPTTTTLPPLPLTELDTAVVLGEDERLPIHAAVPVTADRPEVDDLVASWLAVTRAEFEASARAVVGAREAERARLAAEAEAARLATEAAVRAAQEAAIASSLPPPTTTTTTTVPPPPPPPPPELIVVHDEPVVHPHHTTLRLTSTQRLDGPVVTSSTALHALHDRRVVPSGAWFDPAMLPMVAELVRTDLGAEATPVIDVIPPLDLVADVEADGGGGVVIRLSSELTVSGERRQVVIAQDAAADVLSPLGRALAADEPPPRSDEAPVDCGVIACVALTFDDGPGAHTERLLDVLGHADAVATFLVVGGQVERRPEVVRRTAEDGHEIGNHSWAHDDLRRLEPDELADDIARTDAAIRAATGQEPRFLRPPFGYYDLTVRQLERGFLLWDVDPRDWQHRNPARIMDITLEQVRPGSVVVLHDIHPATVDATPLLIAELRAAGYHLVTASELIPAVEPGTVYRSRTEQLERPPTTTTTTTTTTVAEADTVVPPPATSTP